MRLSRFVLLAAGVLLAACTSPAPPDAPATSGAATLRGNPDGFMEIDLEMDAGAELSFSWQLEEEDARAYFDVHIHREGRVEEFFSGTYHALDGTFVQPSSGGVSLLWTNTGADPVQLRYRLEGAFRPA